MIIEKIPVNLSAIGLFEALKCEDSPIFLDSSISGPGDTPVKHGLNGHSLIFVSPFLKFSSNSRDCFRKLGHLLEKYSFNPGVGKNTGFPLGAAAGYISYDAGTFIEKIKTTSRDARSASIDAFKWPAVEFGFYDCIIVYDHFKNQSYLISTGLPETNKSIVRERAKLRRDYFLGRICSYKPSKDSEKNPLAPEKPVITSNFTKTSYTLAINKIKRYIEQGDVYQVNLSQRYSARTNAVPWLIYKKIRQHNQVPFGAYLEFENRHLLSFSMERFLRINNNEVETRPIKGTAPRGKTPAEDKKNARELLSSAKNLAELLMITDLERNDLGRVCDYGSIRVSRLHEIEKYATVFHLVSTVKGNLHKNKTHLDCLKACFPGGSITGTPKIRAMEIIDELEKTKRNVYCGCIGYFGFNKNTDFNIAIRTIHADRGRLYFNSGGGITYDSDPAQEYEETIHKVRTFLEVL